MSLIDLYSEFVKEREELEIIEKDDAFLTYKIVNHECFISNMFIRESKRNTELAKQMIDEITRIAVEKNCTFITANIHLNDPGCNRTLAASFKQGFKTLSANVNIILIAKEVGSS